MKFLSQPRFKFLRNLRLPSAVLLFILVLSACGTPLAGESWAGISTDGRFIYVAYKENIFRVDPVPPEGSGQPTIRHIDWLAKAPGNAHMYAPPGIGDDKTLYDGAYDKMVYGFPQNTSQVTPTPLGSTPADDRYQGGALVQGDVVYIGEGKQGVRAYNRTNSTLLWEFRNTQYGVWTTPIIVGDVLYFGSLDHNLYALNAKDGTLLWKVDLGGAIAGKVLYDNGWLYAGTFANRMWSINVETHQTGPFFDTVGWAWGGPVLKNNVLYFGDLAGYVYALDKTTMKPIWKADPQDNGSENPQPLGRRDKEHPGGIRGRVALAITKSNEGKDLDIVIAGSESKYLRAYNATTGDVYWTSAVSAEDQILSDLIVINNEVIFTTLSEKQIVAAFNVDRGTLSWTVSLPDEVTRLQTATSMPIPTTANTPANGTAAPTEAPATPAATAAPTSAK